jgi:hypothetical protein
MPSIQITDDGATIKVVIDGVAQSIDKEGISNIIVTGPIVSIRMDNERQVDLNFNDVTVPVVASSEALRVFIESLLDLIPAPAGSATAANQVIEIARLTSILAQLDVALSTRNAEATQLAIVALVATLGTEATLALIKAKTDNLDVALSTIASQATLALLGTEVTQAAILAKQYTQRPSEKSGRTYVSIQGKLAADGTFYTVTGGKVLYLCSMTWITIATTGAAVTADLNDNATPKFSIRTGTAVNSVSSIQNSFQEPLQFTNSIKLDVTAGVPESNFTGIGYEE